MDSTPKVTLADVAQRAGVSVATVSKVINGRYGVSPATIARVHDAVAALGYDAGLEAIRTRGPRTRAVAVLATGIDATVAEYLKGIAVGLEDTGYRLHVHTGGPDHGWERKALAQLAGTFADGAIVIGPTVVNASTSIPTVGIDPHHRFTPRPTVACDVYGGVELATRHLIGLGHRRIAFLGGRPDLESARRGDAAFRDSLAEAGLDVDDQLIGRAEQSPRRAAQAVQAMLRLSAPPTAVVAATDPMALAVLEAALEAGLSVPDDLSIVGFGGVPEACTAPVPLTTVRQPFHEMGREAVGMLLERVGGAEPAGPHVTMPVELVVRESTAPLR